MPDIEDMNELTTSKRARKSSVASWGTIQSAPQFASRVMTKNTVIKLLVDVGTARPAYQDKHLRNLPCPAHPGR